MNHQITHGQIKKLSDEIALKFKPKRIILFGSHAWGKPTSDSDIDLFLIKNSNLRRVDRAREVRRIVWGSGLPVDILVYTQEEVDRRLKMNDFFIKDILEKGKVLYGMA